MRYFNIMLDSSKSGHNNMVICTLNDLKAADELTTILRACTRTFQSMWELSGNKITGLERPYFHFEEDLNYDDDCGSFYLRVIAKDNINEALATVLDHEIDIYIRQRSLWSNRIKPEDYGKTTAEKEDVHLQ